jgi:hypothetical protein
MGKDVGRNDPCPCGSGQKYKRCCLRKRKQRRSSKPARRSGWAADFEKAVESAERAGSLQDRVSSLQSAWAHLKDGVGDQVSTLDEAQEQVGDAPPSVRNWMWDLVTGYRGLHANFGDSSQASEAAELVAELYEFFHGESERVRSQLLAERADFLHRAGDTSDAEALCERIIAEHPTRACGYCTLADIYERVDPPRYEDALTVLRSAAEEPVQDAEDWDLEPRIHWIEDTLKEQEIRASEHFIAWSDFWGEFYEADLDEKLDLARDRIDNAPDFDGEWAYELMVEGLRAPCIEQRRGEDWLDLLDRLRQQHPDVAEEESGYLANSGLGFALDDAPDRIGPLVDLLFSRPVANVDFISRNVEVLASKGWSAIRDHLVAAWDTIGPSGHISSRGRVMWANWTMVAQMAVWADEDINRPRTDADLTEALGPIRDEVGTSDAADFVEPFFGETRPSILALLEDHNTRRASTRLAFAFAHDLVVEHDWPAFEALYSANYLESFVVYCAECDDPFSDQFGTREAAKSRRYRAKLKKLRSLWQHDFEFTPHPDLAVGRMRAILERDMLGRAAGALSFFAATAYFTPWLDEMGLIENPDLTDAIQQHLAQRLPEVAAELQDSVVFPWLLDDRLDATREWLERWRD